MTLLQIYFAVWLFTFVTGLVVGWFINYPPLGGLENPLLSALFSFLAPVSTLFLLWVIIGDIQWRLKF